MATTLFTQPPDCDGADNLGTQAVPCVLRTGALGIGPAGPLDVSLTGAGRHGGAVRRSVLGRIPLPPS